MQVDGHLLLPDAIVGSFYAGRDDNPRIVDQAMKCRRNRTHLICHGPDTLRFRQVDQDLLSTARSLQRSNQFSGRLSIPIGNDC